MKKLLLLFATFFALCSMTQDDVQTMFMIGDSTMANKDTTKGPERGWGMMVQEYFDETKLIVDNHAVNGRSSKSFIDEGRWQKVLDKIKPGDYVVIQFGHNDEKSAPERHTEPGSTFDDNIRKFIRETRAKGGKPIVMNACVRRNFYKKVPKNDDDEALRNTIDSPTQSAPAGQEEGDILYDTHGYYRYSPREVALEEGATFVDANKLTHQLEQALGRERSKMIHMWYKAGEIPEIPEGRQDNTHYNITGAKAIARLLVDGMCKEMPELYRYMKGGRFPSFGGQRGPGAPQMRGNGGQMRGNGQRGGGRRGGFGNGNGGFNGGFGGGNGDWQQWNGQGDDNQ
ncbi:MAG: rhamnogalacturonan acetylesterase [Bacteroidaceae bacterium]|nr:rhamnogalacturonan acetylesterase [Bacteroidaceae bacterium]